MEPTKRYEYPWVFRPRRAARNILKITIFNLFITSALSFHKYFKSAIMQGRDDLPLIFFLWMPILSLLSLPFFFAYRDDYLEINRDIIRKKIGFLEPEMVLSTNEIDGYTWEKWGGISYLTLIHKVEKRKSMRINLKGFDEPDIILQWAKDNFEQLPKE